MNVERLIERLAVIADTSFLDHAAADDLREAAAALAKLQAERDEAREALRPFAAMHEESVRDFGIDFPIERSIRPDDRVAWGFNGATLTWGHFRAASRALGGGE